jgi:hypothetical protein
MWMTWWMSGAMAVTLDVGAGQPYATLADAVAAAANGDVIHLHAGDHAVSGTLNVGVDDLTVQGDGADLSRVVASGASGCELFFDAAGTLGLGDLELGCELQLGHHQEVALSSLRLLEATTVFDVELATFDAIDDAAGIELIDVRRSQVTDSTSSGVLHSNSTMPLSLRVSGSRFDGGGVTAWAFGGAGVVVLSDNWFCGTTSTYANELVLDQGGQATITGNRFVGNARSGGHAGALEVTGPVPVRIDGNVFYGNEHDELPSLYVGGDLYLDHNIFVGSTSTGASPEEYGTLLGATRLGHNLWFDLAGTSQATGPGAVFADPLFVAPSTDCDVADFALMPGSPAIDAGHPSQLDPDGTVRDIGL